jgi:SulP family sulfate permease
MFGFVNGLAIIIFLSQLDQFKTIVNGESVWLSGSPLYIMLGLVLMTIAIVLLFPKKISKAILFCYYCRVWSSFRIRY